MLTDEDVEMLIEKLDVAREAQGGHPLAARHRARAAREDLRLTFTRLVREVVIDTLKDEGLA